MRDKLIGRESDDIDITLDDMYGQEFAQMISEKLYADGVDNGTIDPTKVKKEGYAIIKSNTELSKDLETAVIKIEGESIDLVNLRKEVYDEQTRVPKIEMGNPEEDSYRRDLTLNALFYNLNLSKIEDFTN